ncbi:MAG TPA: glucose 1-dehydrogenase [Acidimicrobiales bacterium]|nr:glucose 1-dehydrogenase [Acidimicrobiales bacterium]
MKLQWKVAIVTGAASGIGAHAARLFAGEGATVVCVDRDHHGANAVVNEITVAGGRGLALTVDVSSEEQVRGMVDRTVEEFGRLDVLFNNAGVMLAEDGDAETTTEDLWDRTIAVNVKGVWLGCKYGIPAMRDTGGGSIINTASFVALMGAATPQLAYTASKGAVLSMTRELAVLHAREGIRVNALCPGPLRTKLLMDFLDTEEKKQRRLVHVPMGRFGEAEEMAKAALFLATDDSSYMTGATFTVDGGITAAYVTPE